MFLNKALTFFALVVCAQCYLINVKLATGSQLSIDVEWYTTIEQLKEEIEFETSIPVAQQILLAGQQLDDRYNLEFYEINEGDTVNLVRAAVPPASSFPDFVRVTPGDATGSYQKPVYSTTTTTPVRNFPDVEQWDALDVEDWIIREGLQLHSSLVDLDGKGLVTILRVATCNKCPDNLVKFLTEQVGLPGLYALRFAKALDSIINAPIDTSN